MRKTTKFFLLNLALSIAGLASPEHARGQFLGYVSPQTVVQTLASTVSCTGSAQVFVTANLGQNQHAATISGNNARQLQMEIDGVDGSGNVTRISDVLDNAQLAPTAQTITGNGYFPIVRVKVTCSGAGSNFTVTYSGTSSTNPQAVGGYQVSQIDKAMFLGLPANATQTDNFQTPFGSSAGFVQFQYNTAGVAGSTITIICGGNLLNSYSTTFNLANVVGSVQSFQVPASPCTTLTLQYVSGGATAGTITAEYIFYVPGTQTTLTTPNTGTSSAPPIMVVSDASSQAFAGTFVGNAIAVNSVNAHVNANNGSRSIYMQRAAISTDTTETIFVVPTTTTGTGCSTSTAVAAVQNLKFGSAVSSSVLANGSPCAAQPTTGTSIYVFTLSANTTIVVDLSGVILPAGTSQGIAIITNSATAVTRSQFFWYEK